jgi:hypothetical protein
VNDRVFWITSHARNKNAVRKKDRLRFFATDVKVSPQGLKVKHAGRAYKGLLDDLLGFGRAAGLPLEPAETQAPEAGGINIEGLAAAADGSLLIGFRSPLAGRPKKALLIPFLNPAEVIDAGAGARFGTTIRLNLGGRGIRSIDYSQKRGEYLIVAGPVSDASDIRLFRWTGPGHDPVPFSAVLPPDFTPEAAIVNPNDADDFLLLSDDGSREIDGCACKSKKLAPAKRYFRGRFGSF